MNDDMLDAGALADDDAMLTALGAGDTVDDGAIGPLLNAWRVELDAAPVPLGAAVTPRPDELSVRRRRLSRGVAASVVAAAMVAGGGVAAAAASGPNGPLGPLHRVLFGGPAHTVGADRIAALLDAARQRLDAAHLVGGIRADQRAAIVALLDEAAGLLSDRTDAPARLGQLLAELRAELALLPDISAPATEPSTPGAPGTLSGPDPSSGSADRSGGGRDSGSDGGGSGRDSNDVSGGGPGGSDGGSDGGSANGSSSTATDGGGSSISDGGGSSSDGGGSSTDGGSDGDSSSGATPSPVPSTGQTTSFDTSGG